MDEKFLSSPLFFFYLHAQLLATMVTFFLKPSTWNNGLESHMGRLLDTNKLTFFQVKLAGILKHKVIPSLYDKRLKTFALFFEVKCVNVAK